jgi:hypothetical protein
MQVKVTKPKNSTNPDLAAHVNVLMPNGNVFRAPIWFKKNKEGQLSNETRIGKWSIYARDKNNSDESAWHVIAQDIQPFGTKKDDLNVHAFAAEYRRVLIEEKLA